jgi:imidazolonepropionase-like amidohydrolase
MQNLIQWSTLNGAEYLGFENSLGSIEIGKTPGINQLLNIENDKIAMHSTLNKIL